MYTIASHFENKSPLVFEIYTELIKALKRFGPIIEEPKKTSIHLVNRTALAGVATRKTSIVLTIKSDRKLAGSRIHKTEQVSANRFHHEIKLVSPSEVDDELIGWLREAYDLSA